MQHHKKWIKMPQRHDKQEAKIHALDLELSSPSLPKDFSSPKYQG